MTTFVDGHLSGRAQARQSLTALPRDTLEQRAYTSIRTAIEAGKFEPGSVINIGELAAQFQISATPVREALKRLQAEQALEVLSSRALAVPRLDRERIAEMRDLRMLIEGFVTESAARYATAEDCDYLEQLHEQMQESSEPAVFLGLNREFHFHIYGLAQYPFAQHIIDLLWLQSGPTFVRLMAYAMKQENTKPSFDAQHRAIVSALRRGDGAGASLAVRTDISTAAALLIELADSI